jgi:hypothetical protein
MPAGNTRTLVVSTDVFAAIWSDRQPGESDEDAILRRKYDLPRTDEINSQRDIIVQIGFHDPRFGVEISSGFEIFRSYKGVEYRAQAIQGFWILGSTGQGYASLHQLNQAVRPGNENAWNVWYYRDSKGRRLPLSTLRDQSKIVRRT